MTRRPPKPAPAAPAPQGNATPVQVDAFVPGLTMLNPVRAVDLPSMYFKTKCLYCNSVIACDGHALFEQAIDAHRAVCAGHIKSAARAPAAARGTRRGRGGR